MTAETQDKPTDAQLVALAERLGWDNSNSYWRHPELLRMWEGAGAVQAVMAGLGYRMELNAYPDVAFCSFRKGEYPTWIGGNGNAPASPDAICLAACAALGVGE